MTKTEEKDKETELPPCPQHLSPRSRELWTEFVPHALEKGRQLLLENVLSARDRLDEVRSRLAETGIVVATESGATRINPLVRVEKELLETISRLFRQLGLDRVKDPNDDFLSQLFAKSAG